jgi:hypothetical protein
VLDRDDLGVGLVLQLVYIQDKHELPLYILKEDGSLGCRVGFAAPIHRMDQGTMVLWLELMRCIQKIMRIHPNVLWHTATLATPWDP